ncbi:SMC5-SMC6 complex localization factor protein 1 [Dictyocoela muelleri]|nr:SMC5-SMC6 complex localization factor protein 1 [Dictyocoela muelleri]
MNKIQLTTSGITDKEIEHLQKHLKNIKFKNNALIESSPKRIKNSFSNEESPANSQLAKELSIDNTERSKSLDKITLSNSLNLTSSFNINSSDIYTFDFNSPDNKSLEIHLTKRLTSKTDFLVVNKPSFTKKYIQAITWKIPIVDIKWLYDLGNYKLYKLGIFQNMIFSTSDITNPIFKNYFIAQGAVHKEKLSVLCDFLIADGESLKTLYARKVGIPIINTNDVFKNDYRLFMRHTYYHCTSYQNYILENYFEGETKDNEPENITKNKDFENKDFEYKDFEYKDFENKDFEDKDFEDKENSNGYSSQGIKIITINKTQNKGKIFENKTFYIDENLPKALKNILRRIIIENGGIRLANISQSLDYKISSYGISTNENIMNYKKNGSKISFSIKNNPERSHKTEFINYSFVFESIDSGYILSTIPYSIQNGVKYQIFSNISFRVGNDLETINKIKALGGMLKDSNATYDVSDTMHLKKNCITVTWIDRCLYSLKINDKLKLTKKIRINDIEYRSNEITRVNEVKNCDSIKSSKDNKNIIFQFTGLPSLLKSKAIEKLESLGIRYIDSMSYEGATHLIMGDINMSEKYLCTLVSGGTILGVDFIDDFNLDKTNQYEWNVEGLKKKEQKIVLGINYWRKKILNEGLPFRNWRVKVYSEKKDIYEKILKCGGASVVENDFTHVFVARDYVGKVDFEHISVDYIFNYIFRKVSVNSQN